MLLKSGRAPDEPGELQRWVDVVLGSPIYRKDPKTLAGVCRFTPGWRPVGDALIHAVRSLEALDRDESLRKFIRSSSGEFPQDVREWMIETIFEQSAPGALADPP